MSLKAIAIIAIMFIGSFGLSAQTDEINLQQSSSENDLAYYGSYDYCGYGTISGAGKIYMEVGCMDGGMVGRYYYVKTNKNRRNIAWIYLSGAWIGNTMTLYEEANGRKNGYFNGSYNGRGAYRGTFYRNDGKRFSFNINLK